MLPRTIDTTTNTTDPDTTIPAASRCRSSKNFGPRSSIRASVASWLTSLRLPRRDMVACRTLPLHRLRPRDRSIPHRCPLDYTLPIAFACPSWSPSPHSWPLAHERRPRQRRADSASTPPTASPLLHRRGGAESPPVVNLADGLRTLVVRDIAGRAAGARLAAGKCTATRDPTASSARIRRIRIET